MSATPPPNTDPAVVATEFLTSLRDGMNDPTTAAIVIALADQDTHSSDALAAVVAEQSPSPQPVNRICIAHFAQHIRSTRRRIAGAKSGASSLDRPTA